MAKVTFNEDKCKGCQLCVGVCPKQIVVIAKDRINVKGFNPATVIEQVEDIRDTDLIPGSGRSSGGGHGNLLWYSCLENPMDRGA